MEQFLTNIAQYWVEWASVALIVSHATLWMSHMKLRVELAKEGVSKSEIQKLEKKQDETAKEFRDKLDAILAIVNQMKGREEGQRRHERT